MTVKYLKLFWYQIVVYWNLKLLDFLSDFVLNILEVGFPLHKLANRFKVH